MESAGISASNGGFGATASIDKAASANKPTKTDTAEAKHVLETEKAAGAQTTDMIQKAGASIDVTA